jgi:hypothetical protein
MFSNWVWPEMKNWPEMVWPENGGSQLGQPSPES